MKRIIIAILFVFGVFNVLSCARLTAVSRPGERPEPVSVQAKKRGAENIRVALTTNAKRVAISSLGVVKVYDMKTRQPVAQLRLAADNQILLKDGRLLLSGQFLATDHIRLVPEPKEYLTVSSKRYRGQMDISVNPEAGGLLVVNYVPLEAYLAGVVPNEVPSAWPEEALKTQAVAARTFALYKMSGQAGAAYDLDASVNSQVYGGLDSEQEATTSAVEQTRGEVMTFRGKYVAAFFHSNCGGRTANVKDVWGGTLDYLGGVGCGFCDNGPHFRWEATLSKADLAVKLKKTLPKMTAIRGLSLEGRDASGRVQTVVLDTDQGQERMKAAAFRMVLGPDLIRSTRFYAEDLGKSLAIKGQGWGHGVGLCQEGALGMAKSGYSHRDILRQYYPGAELRRAY